MSTPLIYKDPQQLFSMLKGMEEALRIIKYQTLNSQDYFIAGSVIPLTLNYLLELNKYEDTSQSSTSEKDYYKKSACTYITEYHKGDIDFFCFDTSAKTYLKDMKKNSFKRINNKSYKEYFIVCESNMNVKLPHSFAAKPLKIQTVFKSNKSRTIRQIIDSFDINICTAYYHNSTRLKIKPSVLKSIVDKNFEFNLKNELHKSYTAKYFDRIKKYKENGFTMTNTEEFSKKIANLS